MFPNVVDGMGEASNIQDSERRKSESEVCKGSPINGYTVAHYRKKLVGRDLQLIG